jgi:hypothetical protein
LLGDAADFAYLCPRSGVEDDAPSEAPTVIDGVDDASEFSATRLALSTIGVSDEDQHDMWRVLAAILHLGNVTCAPRLTVSRAIAIAGIRSLLNHPLPRHRPVYSTSAVFAPTT